MYPKTLEISKEFIKYRVNNFSISLIPCSRQQQATHSPKPDLTS